MLLLHYENKYFKKKIIYIKLKKNNCWMNMNIDAKIQIKYIDNKTAEISYDSLKVDNEGFIESKINENIVSYQIKSKNLGSFLLTTDDLIASHILVEKILNSSK